MKALGLLIFVLAKRSKKNEGLEASKHKDYEKSSRFVSEISSRSDLTEIKNIQQQKI